MSAEETESCPEPIALSNEDERYLKIEAENRVRKWLQELPDFRRDGTLEHSSLKDVNEWDDPWFVESVERSRGSMLGCFSFARIRLWRKR